MSYLTTNQIVKEDWCPLASWTLRAMIRKGKVPGFYVGKVFYINVDLFKQVLQEMSLAPIKGKGTFDLSTYCQDTERDAAAE